MSEAVMMRLAQAVGRDEAYLLVKEAVSSEGREGATLGELLIRDSALRAHLSVEEIEEACLPENYLGKAGALVDEVLKLTSLYLSE